MSDKKLVLLISDKMASNKKSSRNEHSLIRMSSATRNNLKFARNKVEVKPTTSSTAFVLDIFQAYSEDLKKVKNLITGGQLKSEDIDRIGFVTADTYRQIMGNRTHKNIWISDGTSTENQIENLIIGADPEFLLFDTYKNVIRASSVLAKDSKLGNDGAMAELRPDPSDSVDQLVSNITTILADSKLTQKIKDLIWIAECYHRDNQRDYAVGGHIHIGNPKKVAQISASNRMLFFRSFNKILDELLSLPLIKLDGKEKGSSRRTKCQTAINGKNGYGYFGEWRESSGHFEHRTLSGLWLSHPVLAKAVLGTASAIAKEIFRLGANNEYSLEYLYPSNMVKEDVWLPSFNKWKEIPIVRDMECTTSSKTVGSMLHDSDPDHITAEYLRKWYTKLKSMSTYSQHSKYIDALYEILGHSKTELDKPGNDIKDNWLNDKKYIINL